MRLKRYITILLTFFSVSVLGAQTNWEPAYRLFSIKEGLPSSETYFVHQSREGYIWFCTDRGVVKYDGFHMEVLTTRNGLPDNVIFWIYEDYKGRIWFVSYNGLLSYYDIERHKVIKYKYNHLIADYIGNNLYPHKTFCVDEKDNVYFSSGNNGILKIDSKGRAHSSTYRGEPLTFNLINGTYLSTFDILMTKLRGDIFKATIRKNGKLDLRTQNKKAYTTTMQNYLTELKTVNGVRVMRVQDCFYDVDHPGTTLHFPGTTGFFPVKNDLWITTVNGTYKLKNVPKYGLARAPRKHLLQGFRVSAVLKDREKGMWFSTLDKGIVYMPNSIVKNLSVFENSREVDVTHIEVDADKDIFYSNHMGVFRLRDHYPLLRSNHISRNVISRLGKVLLVSKIKKNVPVDLSGEKYWFVPNYYDSFNENDTSVLICSSFVVRINKRTRRLDTLYDYFASIKYNKNLHHFFETVCSSDKGEIFVGNAKGLFCLKKNNIVDNSMFPMEIRGNRVSCVRYSKELGLVIGTRGEGIYVFKNGKIIHHITVANGLLSDQINKIQIDKNGNTCWVATNSGVSKLFFLGNKYVRIHNILSVNGLATNEVNYICLDGEVVYLATKKGISKFPEDLGFLLNPLRKQVSVKELNIDGNIFYPKTTYVEVSSGSKMIHIELRSTNYKSLGSQKYKYRLSEADKWTYGNSGSIDFYDLTSGEYHLELSYLSDNGIWQKPYGILTLNKQPKFVETFWFYLFLVLSSFLLAFVLFRIRAVQINRQRKYKRQIEKLEQKALLAQMNPHFIFNSLNSIQSFLVYNENDLAEKYLQMLSQLIRMTLNNSRESEVTIRQEIDVLTKYIALEKMRFKDRFDFEIIVSLTHTELQKFIPPMLIQPFVENAIIHGFKGLEIAGKLEVNFKELAENRLVVEVTDNGTGYDSNEPGRLHSEHKSYGMQITSERLSLFKEKYNTEFDFVVEHLTDEAGNPKGTKVVISIPIFNKE
ncbi:histidine kinase [uncultured Fluviicola sp.]|uniref:sensor histidine kinase n=1 Tax=uncultured Fluviicola sp. TaxID=463303 RepID=UPI0025FCC296|nr:histidine kinase [uncultured Fluviicola sp.]